MPNRSTFRPPRASQVQNFMEHFKKKKKKKKEKIKSIESEETWSKKKNVEVFTVRFVEDFAKVKFKSTRYT